LRCNICVRRSEPKNRFGALRSETDGFEEVGEADNGQEAAMRAQQTHPDAILMDLLMPGLNGIEATRQFTRRLPGARILVLTSFAADNKAFPGIKAGAASYLLKDSAPDELMRAIRQVLVASHRSTRPSLASCCKRSRPAERQPAPETLTAHEMMVRRLIAQ
jgi:two-component system, NarL family, response regulator LiaR